MPLSHNQTRTSLRIRRVGDLLRTHSQQQPNLLQLALEYQSRDAANRVDVAPHPLPTNRLFRYDFIFEDDDEKMRLQKRFQQQQRQRWRRRSTDVDAGVDEVFRTSSDVVVENVGSMLTKKSEISI